MTDIFYLAVTNDLEAAQALQEDVKQEFGYSLFKNVVELNNFCDTYSVRVRGELDRDMQLKLNYYSIGWVKANERKAK